MFKIFITGIAFVLFQSKALASPMPTERGIITKLQIHNSPGAGSERYMLQLNSTMTVDDGGELCGSDQWTGYLETQGDQAQFSAVLAAKLANKEIWLQGTSGVYLSNEQIIRNVYILD